MTGGLWLTMYVRRMYVYCHTFSVETCRSEIWRWKVHVRDCAIYRM